MSRLMVLLLIVLALPTGVYAADDPLIGQWVLPKSHDVAIRDKDGMEIMKWKATAAQIVDVTKDGFIIRHKQAPGPYEGAVKQSEAVLVKDAPKFFSDKIKEDKANLWGRMCRAEAWLAQGEIDKAIADFAEAVKIDPSGYTHNELGSALFSKESLIKPLKILIKPLNFSPDWPLHSTTVGVPGVKKEKATKPSRTSPSPFDWNPTTPSHSRAVGSPGTPGVNGTGQSLISTRRSA